jgi:hypothetical protein
MSHIAIHSNSILPLLAFISIHFLALCQYTSPAALNESSYSNRPESRLISTSCFLGRNSEQLDQASNCLVMGQASWPKSSRKGIGVYTPTVIGTESPCAGGGGGYWPRCAAQSLVGRHELSSLCLPYARYAIHVSSNGLRSVYFLKYFTKFFKIFHTSNLTVHTWSIKYK